MDLMDQRSDVGGNGGLDAARVGMKELLQSIRDDVMLSLAFLSDDGLHRPAEADLVALRACADERDRSEGRREPSFCEDLRPKPAVMPLSLRRMP
ncbi:hypothetical protein [Enhygromyxa salina]|uniref:hypothetical protein n=1 Tax=Enhygromyxa salina TaxID=215803 RepID=UPI001969EFEA|nr:hypothetical protein [Enhygromyxa salina]